MNNKNIIIIVLVVALAGLGYYCFTNIKTDIATNINNAGGKKVSQDSAQISWTITPAKEKDGIPQTTVAVNINGSTKTVGTFNGSCTQIGASGGIDGKGLLAGELSAVQCWYAGAGDEIGVFAVEDGSIEILIGSLGEQEEGKGLFRGDFSSRIDVKL